MTDRHSERDLERGERRSWEEDEERLREERDRRSDELKESWRRNHPSEEEEWKGRPGKGPRRDAQASGGWVGVRGGA